MNISNQDKNEKGTYEVFGANEKGEWMVRRPDGLMCSGTWKSKEDAKDSCNKWNRKHQPWDDIGRR